MTMLEKLESRAASLKAKAAKKVPLEKDVEGPVKKYARDKGFYVRKFQSPANRSAPDGIFSTPKGVVFFIEFKRPGKKATKAQEDEHEYMRKRGLAVYVIDSVEKGKVLIDDFADLDHPQR